MSSEDLETELVDAAPEKSPFDVGDKVKHSNFHLRMMRGEYRKQAETAIYEVIGVTSRSTTVRPVGSTQRYGPQFPHRYLEKA